jgi:protein-S-isoprenylcysteine O-methyltransferase Ste14
VVGPALLAVGTAVRVGSEERLLRREFGEVYDEYARRVPAIVPRSLGRRTGAAAVASPAASGES